MIKELTSWENTLKHQSPFNLGHIYQRKQIWIFTPLDILLLSNTHQIREFTPWDIPQQTELETSKPGHITTETTNLKPHQQSMPSKRPETSYSEIYQQTDQGTHIIGYASQTLQRPYTTTIWMWVLKSCNRYSQEHQRQDMLWKRSRNRWQNKYLVWHIPTGWRIS